MSDTVKAICIISNHFDEHPVIPKIIYMNRYILDLIGYNLNDVINQDPSKFFLNWNNDTFIQEIVYCVEQKTSWHGDIEIQDHSGKNISKSFNITPVFNITGEICYYSCTTDVEKNELKTVDSNLVCLDEFVCSLWEYHEHFREVCELSPANLLKINAKGDINYVNLHGQQYFGFKNGDNIFDLITNDLDRIEIKDFFSNKLTIGKVSKIDFDVRLQNKNWCLHCKFWPIANKNQEIVGYSISLSDITKNKNIAKEICALKGC